ncbi:hypothetical protein [Nonomuraea sp. NPDC003201]
MAGLVYGAEVKNAIEAELVRQGLSPTILTDHGIQLDEGGYALVLPVATTVIAEASSSPCWPR